MLNFVPRWSQLRAIGNSGPAKLTILIPLVGYFVIFNAQLVHYLDLIAELSGFTSHPLSVSPRLFWIYFGLCAIAVGAALYSMLCPGQVKYYGSAAAYIGGDGPHIKDWAFEAIETELRNSLYKDEYKKLRDRFDPPGGVVGQSAKDQANNGILHIYFRYLDSSYPVMRFIASMFYVVGFVCLMIPSIGVFVRVASILWGTFPLSILF
jgi:hypothetical protein